MFGMIGSLLVGAVTGFFGCLTGGTSRKNKELTTDNQVLRKKNKDYEKDNALYNLARLKHLEHMKKKQTEMDILVEEKRRAFTDKNVWQASDVTTALHNNSEKPWRNNLFKDADMRTADEKADDEKEEKKKKKNEDADDLIEQMTKNLKESQEKDGFDFDV